MMPRLKNVNFAGAIALFTIPFLFIINHFWIVEIRIWLKEYIENGTIRTCFIIASAVIPVIHAMFCSKQERLTVGGLHSLQVNSATMRFVISWFTYVGFAATACSLLGGIFLQKYFAIRYFNEWNVVDVGVLTAVSLGMLWHIIVDMIAMCRDILSKEYEVKPLSKEEALKYNKQNNELARRLG